MQEDQTLEKGNLMSENASNLTSQPAASDKHLFTLGVEPLADARRILLRFDFAKMETSPCMELIVSDSAGQEVGHSFIVDIRPPDFCFTMHLRSQPQAGPLHLQARLFDRQSGTLDTAGVEFSFSRLP